MKLYICKICGRAVAKEWWDTDNIIKHLFLEHTFEMTNYIAEMIDIQEEEKARGEATM